MSKSELLMVRYGEIFLKGQNRPVFQNLLLSRVKAAAKPYSDRVQLHDSRLIIRDISDMEACIRAVCRVFGVHSVCPAVEMDKRDIQALLTEALRLMEGLSGSFKVLARRADKRYPYDSPKLLSLIHI